MRMILSLLLLIASLGLAPLQVRADEADDIAAATERAEEIFDLAADEKFNAMYDLIHPDAHAIVPRVVAVNAFQEIYSYVQAGRAEIRDVEMISWTWGVTGKEYPYAAAVRFEQPYVENGNEQILEDTMYLVQADDGEWRWFFGATREFVEDAIETFGDGQTAEEQTPLVEGDLINNTLTDLDNFYRGAFEYAGIEYVVPGAVLVTSGTSAETACGPAEPGFWAFYCPPDGTIYLDESFLGQLEERAPFAVAFVVAHEFAHHIQTVIGLERVAGQQPDEWNEVHSIELELMADCMSGAWSQDVGTRGLLRPDDIEQTMEFTIEYLGDPAYIDVYDPQAHGSSQQRHDAFMGGYLDGFSACNIEI
ncbi:MAG: neutral zinc metallopeptidase [Chloroflexota bacterium]|jgi:predicted metalloprotease|nr:neutral zinc metallopeptidase [Chloroflexota bacterium]